MILTGKKIHEEVCSKNIILEPFSVENITTNSYDIALGDTLIRYTSKTIDPQKQTSYETVKIPESGFVINKGEFYLGASAERIGSTKYVPILHAKSGTARMGLFVHVTADLIDIGSIGNVTFQLYATLPIILYPGQKIAQMSFWKTYGEIVLYQGKYQNSTGPQVSKTYIDFQKNQSMNGEE